jgi:hypothetical protein
MVNRIVFAPGDAAGTSSAPARPATRRIPRTVSADGGEGGTPPLPARETPADRQAALVLTRIRARSEELSVRIDNLRTQLGQG